MSLTISESRVEPIASLKELVGGSEAYSKLIAWAKDELKEAEINSLNSSVSSSNLKVSRLAIAGLLARYVVANGRPPYLTTGNNPPVDVYTTREEITRAMKDPRYAKDSVYRNAVITKVQRS
jgi:predicted DNA-binding transcriptional regulator